MIADNREKGDQKKKKKKKTTRKRWGDWIFDIAFEETCLNTLYMYTPIIANWIVLHFENLEICNILIQRIQIHWNIYNIPVGIAK
jgi:hypothetical protein